MPGIASLTVQECRRHLRRFFPEDFEQRTICASRQQNISIRLVRVWVFFFYIGLTACLLRRSLSSCGTFMRGAQLKVKKCEIVDITKEQLHVYLIVISPESHVPFACGGSTHNSSQHRHQDIDASCSKQSRLQELFNPVGVLAVVIWSGLFSKTEVGMAGIHLVCFKDVLGHDSSSNTILDERNVAAMLVQACDASDGEQRCPISACSRGCFECRRPLE